MAKKAKKAESSKAESKADVVEEAPATETPVEEKKAEEKEDDKKSSKKQPKAKGIKSPFSEVSQSTEKVTVVGLKDFKKVKKGKEYKVSKNTAEILILKKVVKEK